MTAMPTTLPEIVEPDSVTELVTSASMTGGSGPAGGAELFPGLVVNGPQVEVVQGVSAKPLKAEAPRPARGCCPSTTVLPRT